MSFQDILDAQTLHAPRYIAAQGLTRSLVEEISSVKREPQWMREKRLQAFSFFTQATFPDWGPSLAGLDLNSIRYFVRPDAQEELSWEKVPDEIRDTFEKLGIPEAERAGLGGVGAQYDSEMVYHRLREELSAQGVIFENMDVAVQKYPDLVQTYFMSRCVPVHDHPFAMLHAAVWSGGTFIYVPSGVKVDIPLSAYFRMNAARGGQFEHTLIIAAEGSEVHYIEGCSAPKYDDAALHAGCVEIFVEKGAKVQYSSIENWSKNTYNLNTKRALVDEEGEIIWLNGNMGSAVTMLYPMSVLRGDRSRSRYEGFSFAGPGQIQDTGHKVALVGRQTSAVVCAKSIAIGGGVSTYRGLAKIAKAAQGASVHVTCDGLMLDNASRTHAIPVITSEQQRAEIMHEARVGKVDERALAYLAARGMSSEDALHTMISGFVDPLVKKLPLEYAVELMKLIELEMKQASLRKV
ncbi:Fe-S cluster assembly protein SufB [bacterium]|nr:Fe-S cluster assembly protein SufB [bacterium]